MESKIEILSTINVEHSDDLYKIVDTLNRTLKRDNLMFGLALDEEKQKPSRFYHLSYVGEKMRKKH